MKTAGHNNNMNNVDSWTIGSYVSSFLSIFAGLSFENWLALGGFIVLISTFMMNRHYRKKQDNRDQSAEQRKSELHVLELKLQRAKIKQLDSDPA
jgi:hypothetical protein